MNAPASTSLVAHVVAWHNRQPLARRISADQVTGVGLVMLPFASGQAPAADGQDTVPMPGATLRESAHAAAAPADVDLPLSDDAAAASARPVRGGLLARLTGWRRRRGAEPQAVFSEDFMAPLPLAAVRRFAARHGATSVPAAPGWPQREVPADPALLQEAGGSSPLTLILRTAAIEVGDQRLRVLIGSGDQPAVLGRRAWSLPRSAAVSAVLALSVLGALVAPRLREVATEAPAIAMATTSAVAESAPAPAPAASTVAAVEGAEPAAAASAAEVRAEAPAPTASAAAPEVAARPRDEMPAIRIRPNLREAVGEATRLRARDASRGADAASAATAAAPEPATQTPPALPQAGEVFALASKPARARAAAELRLALLEGAVAGVGRSDEQRTELLQVGPTWRAVWWPFSSRQAAQSAQAELAALGVKVELVAF